MRVIIAGGRDFDDYNMLKNEVLQILYCKQHLGGMEIVSGTARGADKLGERYAREFNHSIKQFPADWNGLGKRAGFVRNADMAKYASEDNGLLIAFWNGKSKGTKHMVDLAKRYGLEVAVVDYGR